MINDEDIIIFDGNHNSYNENSRDKIFKYNIYKNKLMKITDIEIPARCKICNAVYSAETKRVFLFGSKNFVASIDVAAFKLDEVNI